MKKGLSILIVDDNINFISRMRDLIRTLGNIENIRYTTDYDKAIQMLNDEMPQFVLLDINLPGKSGIEILKKIKQNKWPCQVIMVTNHADEYYRKQCYDLGARHFLDKSSEFGLVTEILEQQMCS